MNALKETKVNQRGKECNLNRLSQFQNMCCEVSINAHTHDNKMMATYTYDSFDFENNDFILCLFDSKDESLNTRIDKSLIIGVFNLDEDVYHDVISVYTNDFILSVTTLEKPISLPHCNYCHEEIGLNDNIYWLDGANGKLRLCENCVTPLYPDMEVGVYND